MSVLYQKFEPELKFFGTMNGNSDSHTNAFFCPNEETIVFIDMSALNMEKAVRMIEDMPNLKHFFACVTHTHYDHASGFGKIAFVVKKRQPEELLTIIADRTVSDDVAAHLDSSGMRSIHSSIADEDKVYELLSFDMYGGGYTFCDKYGKILPRMPRPDWFIRTLPTGHSLRVNTSGFAFHSHGKLIVYSGDTNELTPFICFIRKSTEELDARDDPPIEFYLDVATRKSDFHLGFEEVSDELKVLLDEYPTLNLILIHYDDYDKLKAMVEEKIPIKLRQRVHIASRILYANEFTF